MHGILLTSAKSLSGGVRQAVYLAEGLRQAGHDIWFVCPPSGSTRDLVESLAIRHAALPSSLWKTNALLRGLMPTGEPAFVHGFHNRGVKLVAYLGTYWRALGLPVACIAHRGVTSRPGNPLPYVLPGIRAYAVNSTACADTLPLFWRKKRCHVVNNAIPTSRITPARSPLEMRTKLGIPAGNRIIGNVSNDNPQKGTGRAITAFANMVNRATGTSGESRLPASTLVVVGVTPEKWMPFCEQLGIAHRVRLIPPVAHVADYMQLMDVLIFPSMFIESQPNVILEAVAMGIPTIASDIGGIRDCIPDSCLFDPRNEQEMTTKLIALLQNEPLLRDAARTNIAQGDNYTMERKIEHMTHIYEAALAEAVCPPFSKRTIFTFAKHRDVPGHSS